MTVYRKRRQSQRLRQQQRQRQRRSRRNQRGGEGTPGSVRSLAARFGASAGPNGSRPVGLKPAPAPESLTYLNLPGQYGPDDSTPNVLPPVNVGPALPIRAVQPGSIAEERYLQAAEKRAANAKAKANAAAKAAQNALQQAEYEELLRTLNSTPRGPWPGSQQASVAPKSFYSLNSAGRKAAAKATRAEWAATRAATSSAREATGPESANPTYRPTIPQTPQASQATNTLRNRGLVTHGNELARRVLTGEKFGLTF